MIKAKQAFFWTSNSEGYDFHCNGATNFVFDIKIFIVCPVYQTVFFFN